LTLRVSRDLRRAAALAWIAPALAAVERAEGVLQGVDGVAGLAAARDLDRLRDERLGGAPARLIDLGSALRGAHTLERRRSSGAGPASGLSGQVKTS
jgi:hypothetical protein